MPRTIEESQNDQFEPKTMSSLFFDLMKLFFRSDLFEGSDMGARILGDLKLLCALRQRRDGLVEKANSLFGLLDRLRFRFLVEWSVERRFFHDEDDAHHV